jgi:hypothetical protein
MGMSAERHDPVVLYSWERTQVPIEYQAGWASELAWTYRLWEKSFASAVD